MKEAAQEVRKSAISEKADIKDTQVTSDGTWQKRGHSSLNGVVVACSKNGKVIDCQVCQCIASHAKYGQEKKEPLNMKSAKKLIAVL